MVNNIKGANHMVPKTNKKEKVNFSYYVKQVLYIIGAFASFIWLVLVMRYGWGYTNYDCWVMISTIIITGIAFFGCFFQIGNDRTRHRRPARKPRNYSGRV